MSVETALRLRGYRLCTWCITYMLPDNPRIISRNDLVLQQLDLAPEFPMLRDYLDFWQRHIEAPLHSVRVAVQGSLAPVRFRVVGRVLRLD